MATAKKLTIARLSLASDTIANTTDKIEFNNPASDDFKSSQKENAVFFTFQKVEPEGIGRNQAAEKPLGNIQPLSVTETTYILTGKIYKTDGNAGTGNVFLIRLLSWKDDVQVIKDVFEAGRFGIADENDPTNNLTPIGTGTNAIGLIFAKYDKTNDSNSNNSDIILTFTESRGPDI